MLDEIGHVDTLEQLVVETAAVVRPPERLTVSEAAEKYRFLNNPGSYVGKWLNATVPYMVEPMDLLTSRAFTAEVFVGPAQCGKTDILMNWLTHSAICDPSDMMIIQTSQSVARDFSKRRIDRLHRHTKAIGEQLVRHRNSDNTFDKHYRSGMMVTLSWPTINELSGKPIPRLWLTDYDRMPQDVDGEGSPFDLARKRTTTFRSFGMTVVESSPGFTLENPKWIANSRHEAPPTKGILSLYNRGDRRRWYWKCVDCRYAFEPSFALLDYEADNPDFYEAASRATLVCPHCGSVYQHDQSDKTAKPGKNALNRAGRWVPEGMTWTPEGEITGTPVRSDIGSFWLKGPAAAFVDWKGLVLKYLQAMKEYERTGDEEPLKSTVNIDHGEPYTLKSQQSGRLPEDLKARARDRGHKVVPPGVRFLVAAIDVQKSRFVVQVMGVGVGEDTWVVDRFDLRKSARLDEDGHPEPIAPASYLEDWHVLIDEVLRRAYPLADGSGRAMAIKVVGCDSGGVAGATKNAYDFWRFLRDEHKSTLATRFQLLKGDPNRNAPRVRIGYPDSERKDRNANARGEIPILFLNSNSVKDMVDSRLDRTQPGGGMIYFADWLPDTFYTELTVEVKGNKGWENPKKLRNESWDLLAYGVALTLSRHVRIEHLDWDAPPSWAEEWDDNDMVFKLEADAKPFEPTPKSSRPTLAQLAGVLA